MKTTITKVVLTVILLLIPTHSKCWLDDVIETGNVSFEDALKGVEIKIAIYPDVFPWIDYDTTTQTFNGGYAIDIINAVAGSAGFIPNITLVQIRPNETYTQAAQRLLLTYDFVGPWLTDAAERRVLGMNFAHHFADATMLLIIPIPKYEDKQFSVTAFLSPFTAELWIVLICGIIFNAICSFVLYVLSNPLIRTKCKQCFVEKENRKDLFYEFGSYLYTSFGHFTAAGDGFEPNCIYSRINTIMWSFLVVIVLASYTANLATFLISEADVASSLDTIEAIMAADKAVCTILDGIEGQRIQERWSELKLVEGSINAGAFLRNGSCAGALLPAVDVDIVLAESCDMQLTIQRYFPSGGSFAFQSDAYRCGPTIQQLFDYHFVVLDEEGTIEELWNKQVDELECQYHAQEAPESGEDIQLGLYDLGGLSLIYAIGAVVLIGTKIMYVLICEKSGKVVPDEHVVNETELTTAINQEESD